MENNDTHMQQVSTPRTESGSPSATDLARIFNEVTTARLVLRRLRSTDGPAMFSVHGDPATYRYTPVAPHPDLATSEEMLQECLQHWEIYGFGLWAVTLAREAEKIIGFGGVEH